MADENKNKGIERLVLEEHDGVMNFGRLPWKVHYDLDIETEGEDVQEDERICEKLPSIYKKTPNLRLGPSKGPTHSVSIYVWKDAPKLFKEVLMYHELREAEYHLVDEMEKTKAHNNAVIKHIDYAKKFLSVRMFNDFINWQRQFDRYMLSK